MIRWDWLSRNIDVVLSDLWQHIEITVAALALGAAIAFPVGLIAYRWRRSYPPILAITQVLYTIPSLALFVLLINAVGLGTQPVIIGLAIYSLVILVRNLVEGLRGVPPEVTDAATAMGYRETRRLFVVELPLALPAIVAGLRVAVVSTIALATVAAFVVSEGLGGPILGALPLNFKTEIIAAGALAVGLAIFADALLVLAQRLLTPWAYARRAL